MIHLFCSEHVRNAVRKLEKLKRKDEKLRHKAHKLKKKEEKIQRQLAGSRGNTSGQNRPLYRRDDAYKSRRYKMADSCISISESLLKSSLTAASPKSGGDLRKVEQS